MKLSELFTGAPDVEVTDLAYDSRSVTPGALFFCVSGFDSDGHRFAHEAITNGAAALVVERPLGLGVPEIVVPLVRAEMAPAAARFFREPSAELAVVGVTGTNGKTTTSFLIRAMVEAAGRQCGLIGTIKRVIGGKDHPSIHTTPEAIDLQRDLRAMVEQGDRVCAMEVSSHGLALYRSESTHFDVTVFTNVTQDHLDFHRTMEDYFQAKRRLFVGESRMAVVNLDDPYGARLARELPNARTFGLDARAADYHARGLLADARGTYVELATPTGIVQIRCGLPGRFNVYNALGAYAAAVELGIDEDAAAEGIAQTPAVPGRFERVDAGQPFGVYIDSAHTPDALKNALETARELTEGRLICVFGCAGDRDPSTRPAMGHVARSLADVVVVTSDNPNSESPESIIEEIVGERRGAEEVVVDRTAAIHRAIELAEPDDCVVIAGRGHEREQRFATGAIPLDDREVARAAVRARVLTLGY